MKTSSIPRLVLTLTAGAALAAALSACVPLVVGGAAVGAGLVATDRRTSGAQLDHHGHARRAAARLREIANDQMYVSVTSFNRQMLLTGTVANEADRRRVEAAVQGIDNVRSVVNEVQVGEARSFQVRSNDTFITGKVKASLLDAKDLFANSFKIVTDSGVVYLMGLATRREIDRATDITRGVSGVQKVVRVVEVITEAELANQATSGGTQQNTAPAASTHSSSRVPLPPMEPLKTAPATGGATVSPVR